MSTCAMTCGCGITITAQAEHILITDIQYHKMSKWHRSWDAEQSIKRMNKSVEDDGWEIKKKKYGRLPYITCAILTIALLAWAVFLGK